VARKIDLVVTTIFEPAWLPGYLDDLRVSGLEATLRVIGDRKTPASVWQAADDARAEGFDVRHWTNRWSTWRRSARRRA
jgi:hypothetical protein